MRRVVYLWKVEDSSEILRYAYGESRDITGILRVEKKTEALTVEHIPGMIAADSWLLYGHFAATQLQQWWKTGDYPNEAVVSVGTEDV